MRTYRDEANRRLNESLDRNNGFSILQSSTEYAASANTLAILELAEQQRIANLIALGFITTDTVCETPRTLEAERRNFADWFPEIAVSLGMNTDQEEDK